MVKPATLTLFGTDFADAFHQVPLDPSERQFTAVYINDKYYIFNVLVFGAASAPTVWGRYAAFIGRSSAAILRSRQGRIQVYVDDPLAALSGSPPYTTTSIAILLLWFCYSGLPISWKKSEAGTSITWISARICLSSEHINGTIPQDKVEDISADLRT